MTANLWPPLDQMKQFLEGWEQTAVDQNARIVELTNQYAVRVAELEQQIANYKVQASESERPLRQLIIKLETENVHLSAEKEKLSQTVSEVTTMLAKVLETNINVPGVTIETLLRDAVLLVESSKRTFRRNL